MGEEIRVGLIGGGSFAGERARAFSEIEGCRVTRVWSRSGEKRERLAGKIGCVAVDRWEAVAESEDVDAIVVSTCHVHHYAQARAALSASKHALVETPLAMTSAEAQDLADRAREKGVVLHHGAKWRYHDDHHIDVENVQRVGELLHGMTVACWDYGPERKWYGDRALSGGSFALMPYHVLIFVEAFGPVDWATGWETVRDELDVASITMGFRAGGTVAFAYGVGRGIAEINESCFLGTEGAVITSQGGPVVLMEGERRTELPQKRPLDVVLAECRAFAQEVRGERDHLAFLDDDLESLRVVDLAREDALGRRE